jgi:hypothetical protein
MLAGRCRGPAVSMTVVGASPAGSGAGGGPAGGGGADGGGATSAGAPGIRVVGSSPQLLVCDIDLDAVTSARQTLAVLSNRADFVQVGKAESRG